MAKVDGGYLAAKALKAEGVKYIFTLASGGMVSYYEGCKAHGINVVDVRHEQAAAMAADGWARVTGKPGVALFDSGPGFGNAYTGIINAHLAGSPAVYISRGRGSISRYDMGQLMELDREYAELARPITKWARVCYETKRIPEYVSTAFRQALAGRPGPVYLEVPAEVLKGHVNEEEVTFPTNYRTEARAAGDSVYIKRAAELILKAERPVVIAGSGVLWSKASQELEQFITAIDAPVYLNGMGRGSVPADHPLYFEQSRQPALKEADVAVVIGAPFDFRLGFGHAPAWAPGVKVIQIDIDAAEIGRNRPVDVGIQGDPQTVIKQLLDQLGGSKRRKSDWVSRLRKIEDELAARQEALMNSGAVPIHPMRLCKEIRDFLERDAFIVGDGGFIVNYAARIIKLFNPGHWLDPGPMGCLGVGPGFAMAAKLANPAKQVLLISGDGAFGLNGMEFDTMARHSINVVGVVGNNCSWAQVEHSPGFWKGAAIACELGKETRYDKMVEALGCYGESVTRPQDIRPALERAFASGKPALLNVVLSNDPQHYPRRSPPASQV